MENPREGNHQKACENFTLRLISPPDIVTKRRCTMNAVYTKTLVTVLVSAALVLGFAVPGVFAQCPAGQIPVFPGADDCILDPGTVDKYYIPLVIPPVMKNNGTADSYDIAVRQFGQQILPGGIWATLGAAPPTTAFPATTVWSYGPAADLTPLEFDLLVPPYDTVKIATVGQVEAKIQHSRVITGKRLGFQFNSDDVLVANSH